MKAKCAYTYGWSDVEMNRMEYQTFLDYWIAITIIESEQQLLAIEAACSHMIKQSTRKEMIARYRKNTTSMIGKAGRKLGTIQDVAKAFARMRMNG